MKMTQKRMARPSLGGLLATRQGALALALLCAIFAAGILIFALGRYKANIAVGTKQATVLVATGSIPKGTSGQAIAQRGLYKSLPIVSTQLAPGAISDSSLLPGRVTAIAILPGQQLTVADFTTVTGVTGALPPNQRAVSVSLDEVHGDIDVVSPGDHIDIYAQFTSGGSPEIVLLLPNVLVLKPAGPLPGNAGGTPIAGGSMVLSLTAAQVPLLDYGLSDGGNLYVSLRPDNATNSPTTPTTLASVLQASSQPTTTGAHP